MPVNRRRGHGSDEEEDDDFKDPKRYRRGALPPEDRLEQLIVQASDTVDKSQQTITNTIEEIAGVLETEMITYKTKIMEILLDCVVELPEKLTIYSTLVGLINAKSYNFGGEFVEALMNNMFEYLRSCDFDNALHCVVFMSNLVNCRVVTSHSFLSLLDNFIAVTVEQDVLKNRADWYTFAVLCALPYVGKELASRHGTVLEQLLEGVVAYLNKREKLHIEMLRVWSSNKPHPQEEYLDCLWAQIDKLRSDSWEERHIARYYNTFDSILKEALQHNLPSFVPPAHTETSVYPVPRVVFRLFDYTDCPDDGPVLPGAHSIERFLIEQELGWIIRTHHLERKTCAAALVSYPERDKVPLNYMIVEVIFSKLFNLPTPPYMELFYGSLLIELCKLQPNSMPQVLAQAAEMLYQRIDTMQIACFDRFVDWFAYHLSNFQFRWSWDDWADALTMDSVNLKQLFVREVLAKSMRLSYHQRLMDIMPANFAPLLPPKPEPHFKYSRSDAEALPGTSIAQQLALSIRQRCTPEEVLQLLKECPNPFASGGGDDDFNPLKVDVLLSTLLNLGSKSFSHSFAALAKYHMALKSLTENNDRAQSVLLDTLYELWKSHPQMLVVIVDKLLKMQIVDCVAVVNFIFSDSVKEDFVRMYVWEILLSALSKLTRHVNKLRKDLDEAKAKTVKEEQMDAGETEQNPENVDSTVVELETKLSGAEDVQKTMFLTLFQRFVILLSEYLIQSETEGKSYDTDWFRLIVGRLRQVFLLQHEEVFKYTDVLEKLLFPSDTDPHVLEVFHQFCALQG